MWGSSYGEYLEMVVVQYNCYEVPVAVEGGSEWLLPTISGDRLRCCLLEPVVSGVVIPG